MNTAEDAMYKYFVFGEDIALNNWVGNDRGDFVMANPKGTLGYYVFGDLYGNVDALGHSLNVSVNNTVSSDRFGGIIGNNYCYWKNLVCNIDATYKAQAFGILACNAWGGQFEDCFIKVKATKVDSLGSVVPDTDTSIIYSQRGTIKNCIILVNQADGSEIRFFGDVNGSKPTFENVIFIKDSESSDVILSHDPQRLGRQFINCYHYKTIEDFLNGKEGALINVPSGEEYSSKPVDGVIAYELFGDVWTINEKEVKLVDNQIIKIFDTGDNFVNDKDIVG